jgi:1-acyl-sn-glycerol-3-phosphate acyltransferase
MSRPHAQLEMDPAYGFFYGLCRLGHQMFFRGDVRGLEHLPRQVSFFARKTLWKPGLAAWWLTTVGTIPVDRDGGTSLDAIKRVLAALATGKVVIVFPEGTRSVDGRLQPPKAGVGLLACRARVPVVPARIFGSFEAFGRDRAVHFGTPVDITYGPPLYPPDYDHPQDGKERYARTAERIMAAITVLRPPTVPVL